MVDRELVEKVFNCIDQERLVNTTRDLVRIPSEPVRELEKMRYLEGRLREAGVEVIVQQGEGLVWNRPNVIGILRGRAKGKCVLLHSHTDTLPPVPVQKAPYCAEVKDERIYGLGTSDMIGGLAASIETLQAIKDSGIDLRGTVIFAAVCGERHGTGSSYLVKSGLLTGDLKPDFAIITEPSAMEIGLAHGGCIEMVIETFGRPGHPADITGTFTRRAPPVNAVLKMVEIINELNRMLKEEAYFQYRHELVGPPRFYIGAIEGGSVMDTEGSSRRWPSGPMIETGFGNKFMESCIRESVNASITPEFCRVRIGMRTPPGKGYGTAPSISTEEFVDMVKKRIAKLQKEDPTLEAKVTLYWDQNLPSVTSPEEPEVKLLQEALEYVRGRKPLMTGFNYIIDQPYLTRAGIPTVNCGPVAGRQLSAEEYITFQELIEATKVYIYAVLAKD